MCTTKNLYFNYLSKCNDSIELKKSITNSIQQTDKSGFKYQKWTRFRFFTCTFAFFCIIYLVFTIGLWDDSSSVNIINIPLSSEVSYSIESLDPTSINVYSSSEFYNENHTLPEGYLVYSPDCQIRALDPFADDVMKLFHKENYENCSHRLPLTNVKRDANGTVLLHYNELFEKAYAHKKKKVVCCYQEIRRAGDNASADFRYNLSGCVQFTKTFELPSTIEFILVTCRSAGKVTYINAHAIITRKKEIGEKLTKFALNDIKRPLSVLMIGIDSISRLNFIRAMPLTAKRIHETGWFELQGYNKIADNTYPNLMAVLVGYNISMAYEECQPNVTGKLEKCPFVWENFRQLGYVTAYGEDEAIINTFNFCKKGFVKPPTDYYLRPFLLSAEHYLEKKKKHSLTFCLGFKHSADHVYDYALDYVTQYKNKSFFGLFWANTFSHNEISDPSAMDLKMMEYLHEYEKIGILNESAVIFFSDHGLRFGAVRYLFTGWMEERLPFMYIWLPNWFKKENPQIVQALKVNRNRLTNPYDLHMTLKHILELSGRAKDSFPSALGCTKCQSFFKEIPFNRSCEDASIDEHWCTCAEYKSTNKNSDIVKNAVKFVINHINKMLYETKKGKKSICAELKLRKLLKARRSENRKNPLQPFDNYIFLFEASPSGGVFEATVRYLVNEKTFSLSSSVSRVNSYASESICIKIERLRKYCYCLKH